MKKYTLLMAIAFLLISKNAIADFKILNNTADSIIVAIGYIENGVPTSEGWFTLKPGELKTIKPAALPGNYYYYYANSLGVSTITGTMEFYVCGDKGFKIKGNNIAGVKNPKKIKFKQNTLPATNGNYTLSIGPDQISRNVAIRPSPLPRFPKPPIGQHQAMTSNKSDN